MCKFTTERTCPITNENLCIFRGKYGFLDSNGGYAASVYPLRLYGHGE
jgi:hypothetical protein